MWHSHTLQCYKKDGRKKFQIAAKDNDVTNYVNFFEKLCEKWLKYIYIF